MTAPLTLSPAWRVVGHATVALLCLSVLVPMLVVLEEKNGTLVEFTPDEALFGKDFKFARSSSRRCCGTMPTSTAA